MTAWKGWFVKTTHPDNLPSKLLRYPKGYGYSYIAWGKLNRLKTVFLPIPINWVARKCRDIYGRLKYGKSEEYGDLVYAKRAGYREGVETAIAVCKQSQTTAEAISKLRATCL